VLFGALCVIWGIPYLLIKVAVGELAPATLVLSRTALGAVLLLPIAAAGGRMRGLRAAWLPLAAYTAVEICGPWLLLGFAETRLSSSMTGLLIAAVPLVGAVLARWTGERERLGWLRIAGLLVGLAGVAALVGLDVHAVDATAVAALGLVVVGYAAGPMILARRLAHLPSLGVVAASLALAAVVTLPLGVAQAPGHWPSARVLAAVAVLAAVCTALAFVLFLRLVAEVGPPRATVITYVNPAVAILLGVLLLDEPFTPAVGIGFVLVLTGSVLATSSRHRARSAPTATRARPRPVPVEPANPLATCPVPEP